MSTRDFPAIVDVGANLAHKRFRDDLPTVLARAKDAGIGAIVVTGTSLASSRAALGITRDHGSVELVLRATAGVHPHDASSYARDTEPELRRLLTRREVVAVGECGLDYDRMFSPREAQLRAFEAQLDIAASLDKPVFLHERMAHEDFVAVLAPRMSALRCAMIHCFTGTAAELERYLSLGLHVGITGYVCDPRRGKHLSALVREIPRGRLHIETDAPFLVPRDLADPPKDGRNEPALLRHVLATIAKARGEEVEDTALHTREASRTFFGIRPLEP